MSLISSLSQAAQNQNSSSRVAPQSSHSGQQPENDFDKLIESERPETEKAAEQISNNTEAESSNTEEPVISQDDSAPDSEAEQNQVAELAELVEAQANWKPVGSTTQPTNENGGPATSLNTVVVDEHSSKQSREAAFQAITAPQAQAVAEKLVGQNAIQNPVSTSSLMVQQAVRETVNPEQFQQDDLADCDIEDLLPAKTEAGSESPKTNLDIQQLVARLNTVHTTNTAETPQTNYSQASSAVQNIQASAAGSANTPATTQSSPANEPALSMFNDPDWPEDLGQRLFRLSSGDDGVKEVSLRLDPPSLGMLDIKLKIDDNSLSVQFQSSSPQVRELLQNQADRLRASLNDANMNLVDVDVSSGQGGNDHHAPEHTETLTQGSTISSTAAKGIQNPDAFGNSSDQDGQGTSHPVSNNLYLSTYA